MKRRISIIVLFLFFMGLLPSQIVKAATSIEAQMTVNGVAYSASGILYSSSGNVSLVILGKANPV